MSNGLENMLGELKKLRPSESDGEPYSLYIAGGFDDDQNSSIDLSIKLFSKIRVSKCDHFKRLFAFNHFKELFARSSHILHLKMCIVTKLNDSIVRGVHYPIVYGLGYNIKERTAFKCNRFIDKGPDMLARSAKHYSTNSVSFTI